MPEISSNQSEFDQLLSLLQTLHQKHPEQSMGQLLLNYGVQPGEDLSDLPDLLLVERLQVMLDQD